MNWYRQGTGGGPRSEELPKVAGPLQPLCILEINGFLYNSSDNEIWYPTAAQARRPRAGRKTALSWLPLAALVLAVASLRDRASLESLI